MIGLNGKRYITKASMIKAMSEHKPLKEAYVLRHAHKRQYLSSWAKAKVEHCMNVEIRPWLSQNFEKGAAARNK
jgi:ribose 1,5-bisphosphokinase PhnN